MKNNQKDAIKKNAVGWSPVLPALPLKQNITAELYLIINIQDYSHLPWLYKFLRTFQCLPWIYSVAVSPQSFGIANFKCYYPPSEDISLHRFWMTDLSFWNCTRRLWTPENTLALYRLCKACKHFLHFNEIASNSLKLLSTSPVCWIFLHRTIPLTQEV